MTGRTPPTNAIITASYGPDFERCAILCESIDRHVTGYEMHYLLVDTLDAPLFRQLESDRRKVISDRDLLPWWLFRVPGRIAPKGRPVWLSPVTKPLHGWHVQQLRRIAIAHIATQDALFYCDSDTAFVKPYDLAKLWKGPYLRLFREDDGSHEALSDHMAWLDHATTAFGMGERPAHAHNYVRTFLSWRRDTVIAMCKHMELIHNRPWQSVIGSSRKFSECTLYGVFVDEISLGADHWHDSNNLCPMHWFDPAPTPDELAQLVDQLGPDQVGFGVQSFIAINKALFRRIALGA